MNTGDINMPPILHTARKSEKESGSFLLKSLEVIRLLLHVRTSTKASGTPKHGKTLNIDRDKTSADGYVNLSADILCCLSRLCHPTIMPWYSSAVRYLIYAAAMSLRVQC